MEKKDVNREVKLAIKIAKLKYNDKVKQSFTQGNLHSAWQHLRNMAAVNTSPHTSRTIQVIGNKPATLPNDLNSFYSRSETDNSTQLQEVIATINPGHSALTVNTEDVVRALKKKQNKNSTKHQQPHPEVLG